MGQEEEEGSKRINSKAKDEEDIGERRCTIKEGSDSAGEKG